MPQAEPLRPKGGRGHGAHPRPGPKPGARARRHPGPQHSGRGEVSAGSRSKRRRKAGIPPPPQHEATRRTGSAGSPLLALTPPILPSSHRPGDGHGRLEPGRADGGRRDGGAGALPGPRALGLARAWGAAPGLGPAGDPRAAAERGRGRRRSECRSPGRGGGGVGESGERPSERGLKPRFPHHRGEAQCLVLYEQPSCIYSLPP